MTDVTRRLYEGHPVWPGDTPYSYELVSRIAEGEGVNVGRLTTTHLGTPYHYVEDGGKLESVPLEVQVGPCRVVDARGQAALSVEFLQGVELAERILFYTGEPNTWSSFPQVFMHVLPEAVQHMAAQGVRLYGTDGPSVDPLTSAQAGRLSWRVRANCAASAARGGRCRTATGTALRPKPSRPSHVFLSCG